MGKLRQISAVFGGIVFALGICLTGCGGDLDNNDNKKPDTVPHIPEYTVADAVPDVQANDDVYAIENITQKPDSPLANKTVYWLGSSVTDGAASQHESMADYLSALTGCTSVKEAVSGTTLYDDGGTGDSGAKSYTRRLVNSTVFDKSAKIDAFVCQISTNDAWGTRKQYWGRATQDVDLDSSVYNRKTTLGGIEFIITYVIENWNCPIYFYSGAYFGDSGVRKSSNPSGKDYGTLVGLVSDIVDKWAYDGYDVKLIDMYNDEDFNAVVTDEYYSWCMNDAVHPKRAGYLQWWTPYFEHVLITDLTTNK